ncbi:MULTISPECIES: thioredoxin-disulfide reductase [Clostridium]|jgi:thioredoxin reductase (NADPH)|uniref:Thioredoxin reductase n=1 Tax=Clostridium beijerinckii TaxID=1520 RepID=A0AAW3WDN1_CLOBE|nr:MULTISPECIES: thioredoxin-disulfide reductase [Clostridium]ALB48486.1 thioredoxin-disulfide reductase [Clostridium beijerinckii NRRL B-598]AVK49179.1 thioredoxin reductase [Clostridium sp. MF28]MBC2459497.1 thioredoxin-disulfide reductase [Clostridium beijerinckii]MBC2476975.1 thioredoxin-disulfide reductase [Clostridium beijerinckii]MCI1478021.1 thioredoxin-disulfide reductase [Clostridium beijerinckii]
MSKEKKELDLIIIGGGPAGLTAAMYAGRAKLDTLLLENELVGGQVRNSYTIENYPGFKSIGGGDLADIFQEQARDLGANIDEFDSIEKIYISDDEKIIETESYVYQPKAVIIATGAAPRKLPIPQEEQFSGRGIHYCAICDGALYQGKKVAVVGGGNSALEESIFLTRFAEKVYLIRRYDYFKGEQSLIDEVFNNPKIEVLLNKDLTQANGKEFLESVIIKDTKTQESSSLDVNAVFGYIGTEPRTKEVKDYIKLNEQGYIITDEDLQTNIQGVYAAGDVRQKKYRQITTAVSDGTIALLNAEKYILRKRK